MAFQILLNILIAVLWMFLQSSFTPASFVFGYLIGILILYLMRKFLMVKVDLRKIRLWAVVKLFFLFVIELTKANIDMVKVVLKPQMDHQPGIVAVRTKLNTEIEITLLAALISLTPGTVSMDFSPDNKTIYIHAIDVPDEDEMIEDIHNSFERAIMEVTK
ncbi:Na+/H+ antiporter subunit E [Oceanobacillus alkalisoli]|uniref:Na+/H+ antiporter subunit E n=1 Tax=Oceanobacillus alkalisoli TaxID=2925113 RepID=UPI001EF0D9CB|nr:Na+/H+ antiporter subunit E [Oceanobacillus alkalisoli]MCF3944886.1 Na+/H+ antiporter subunit E [Oceanobacillus alkalisoli]MCG5103637.1 Na+/H+ antiporter subunit E [Oceanobacillus alkalisoli]